MFAHTTGMSVALEGDGNHLKNRSRGHVRLNLCVALLALITAQPVFAEEAVKASHSEATAFVQADSDKTRTLDASEFRVFVDALAKSGQSTASTIRYLGLYGMAFRKVDTDKNGVLTPRELRDAHDGFRKNGK